MEHAPLDFTSLSLWERVRVRVRKDPSPQSSPRRGEEEIKRRKEARDSYVERE